MARPPKEIDPEFLKKVMRTYPSLVDAAALCDCDDRTLERYIRKEFDMTFKEFRNRYAAATRDLIKKKQLQVGLEKGNVAMLIWLGKVYCQQTDRDAKANITINNNTSTLSDAELDTQIKELTEKLMNETAPN